jgi:hypothetical protein
MEKMEDKPISPKENDLEHKKKEREEDKKDNEEKRGRRIG